MTVIEGLAREYPGLAVFLILIAPLFALILAGDLTLRRRRLRRSEANTRNHDRYRTDECSNCGESQSIHACHTPEGSLFIWRPGATRAWLKKKNFSMAYGMGPTRIWEDLSAAREEGRRTQKEEIVQTAVASNRALKVTPATTTYDIEEELGHLYEEYTNKIEILANKVAEHKVQPYCNALQITVDSYNGSVYYLTSDGEQLPDNEEIDELIAIDSIRVPGMNNGLMDLMPRVEPTVPDIDQTGWLDHVVTRLKSTFRRDNEKLCASLWVNTTPGGDDRPAATLRVWTTETARPVVVRTAPILDLVEVPKDYPTLFLMVRQACRTLE